MLNPSGPRGHGEHGQRLHALLREIQSSSTKAQSNTHTHLYTLCFPSHTSQDFEEEYEQK